jgi:hypothetical protein
MIVLPERLFGAAAGQRSKAAEERLRGGYLRPQPAGNVPRTIAAIALQIGGVACRVKIAAVLVALTCTSQIAAAQQTSPYEKHPRATNGNSRTAPPIAIPQQIAPPQEAFASQPEKETKTPAAPSDCDLRLGKIAAFQQLSALIAPGECGAPDAVLLESVILPDQGRVALAPPATLRCTMAEAVAHWIREDVAPAAAKLGAPPRELENMGSYECRGRNRVSGATLSEHGRANALDVRGFRLANKVEVVLADPKVPRGFRDAIRTSACARFSTVLGPGADAEHAEHVHLDLIERRNNFKMCQWDVREPAVPAEQAKAQEALIPIDEVPLPIPRPLAADDKLPISARHSARRRIE